MTYPFMEDPVPPGHGEPIRAAEGSRNPSYSVQYVLPDGNPRIDERFSKLDGPDGAYAHKAKVIKELEAAGYTRFFVGVMDDDDPERGWLFEGEDD